jgi:hypothetical protein
MRRSSPSVSIPFFHPYQYQLQVGVWLKGESLKAGWAEFINFKLDSFASGQHNCVGYKQPLLELITQPRVRSKDLKFVQDCKRACLAEWSPCPSGKYYVRMEMFASVKHASLVENVNLAYKKCFIWFGLECVVMQKNSVKSFQAKHTLGQVFANILRKYSFQFMQGILKGELSLYR